MSKIKIYTFGSCRTNYINLENDGKYSTINRDFFSHSPFEILQMIDFFDLRSAQFCSSAAVAVLKDGRYHTTPNSNIKP